MAKELSTVNERNPVRVVNVNSYQVNLEKDSTLSNCAENCKEIEAARVKLKAKYSVSKFSTLQNVEDFDLDNGKKEYD